LRGAKSLLLCITGGRDMTLWEVEEAASRVCQEADPDANIIVGATFDDGLGDRIRVSIVASGMPRATPEPAQEPELPVWTPKSQRDDLPPDPFGRRLEDVLGVPEPPPAAPPSRPSRSRARGRRALEEADAAAAGPMPDAPEMTGPDGLSALPKAAGGRSRRNANGSRKLGENGQPRRPVPPQDSTEMPPEPRRGRGRRAPSGNGNGTQPLSHPPVNWRELTAAPEAPPAPPASWRELSAAGSPPPPPAPDFSAPIIPERDPDMAPRKMGFFARLGFGRSRRQA
jgi:cell division protein FtsZ